jgi:acetolactate synthase-1/3 small subunit
VSARSRTFVAYVEDKPGVLNRVSSLFRRRGFNIESLTVGQTDREGVSRMTVVIHCDDDVARRVVANLYKLVNVLRVDELDGGAVVRDLALIKVRATPDARTQVLQLCEVFRARVVDVAPDKLIIEITGTQSKIDGFVDVLRPFGIEEMVRTGAIAMTRGSAGVALIDDVRGAEPASPSQGSENKKDEEIKEWQPSSTTRTLTSV